MFIGDTVYNLIYRPLSFYCSAQIIVNLPLLSSNNKFHFLQL